MLPDQTPQPEPALSPTDDDVALGQRQVQDLRRAGWPWKPRSAGDQHPPIRQDGERRLPAHHRVRLLAHEMPPPRRPRVGETRPEATIRGVQRRAAPAAFKDRELLAQGEALQNKILTIATQHSQRQEKEAEVEPHNRPSIRAAQATGRI